jgi:hypothetical protein
MMKATVVSPGSPSDDAFVVDVVGVDEECDSGGNSTGTDSVHDAVTSNWAQASQRARESRRPRMEAALTMGEAVNMFALLLLMISIDLAAGKDR